MSYNKITFAAVALLFLACPSLNAADLTNTCSSMASQGRADIIVGANQTLSEAATRAIALSFDQSGKTVFVCIEGGKKYSGSVHMVLPPGKRASVVFTAAPGMAVISPDSDAPARLFTIKNDSANDRNALSVTLSNINITGGRSNLGSAFVIENSKVKLDGCMVNDNTSLSDGAGISIYDSDVVINNSKIQNNRLEEPEYSNLMGSSHGGGISALRSNLEIIDSEISGNRVVAIGAAFGAGVHISDGSLNISRSTIKNNEATSNDGGTSTATSGGGIQASNSNISIAANSLITGNVVRSATIAEGGGIFFADSENSHKLNVAAGVRIAGNQPDEIYCSPDPESCQ